MIRWTLRTALLGVVAAGAVAQQSPEEEKRYLLREIRVTTRDVYDEPESIESLEDTFYSLLNLLHATTGHEVVRREIWFDEGAAVTPTEVAELERNLRRFGLFGTATANLAETGVPGERDLEVETRDRFSLIAFAGLSSVGGVSGTRVELGERNFLGTGKRVVARATSNSDGESAAGLTYFDPQLLGSWHRLTTNLDITDEGHAVTVDVTRPFHHLTDPYSWGSSAFSVDEDVNYYAGGDTVSEVPLRRDGGGVFFAIGQGPRQQRSSLGFDLGFASLDYGTATGLPVRVPGDTTRWTMGITTRFDWVSEWLKRTRIDAIDFVEDVTLGVSGRLRIGGVIRDEEGSGSDLQPELSGGLRWAFQPVAETFVTVSGDARARWSDGRTRGYDLTGAVHAFHRSLPAQTLAGSLAYDAAYETQDLPPQLTLGEDNGLRGYPAREFAGTRLVRLNLEDRIDTGLEVASVHLGLVAFYDVGWVHGPTQGLSLGDAIQSVGFGLRFGSSAILGRNVMRLDFGFPLDQVAGEDFGTVSVSFSAGQVFSFFGNASELRREF